MHVTGDTNWSGRQYLVAACSFALLFFGMAWVYVVILPMAFSDMSYVEWAAKRSLVDRCDLGQIVIFGDSRIGTAVNPARLPIKVTSLALAGTGTIEMFYVLKKALRCENFPKRVVLSWTYLHLIKADSDFWGRAARSGLLSYGDLRDIARTSHELNDLQLYQARREDGLPSVVRDFLYSVRFPPFYFNDLLDSWGFTRYPINMVRLTRMLDSRGHLSFGDKAVDHSVMDDAKYLSFVPSRLMDHYLDSILNLLEARDVRVDIVMTPINETTGQKISQEIRGSLRDYVAEKELTYTNLHMAGQILESWPDDYFGDNLGHLNARGVNRYTDAFTRLVSFDGTADTK